MDRLLLLGLNHTTAPLEVRERLAFNAQQRNEAVERFRQKFEACEIVLLSTCNRVELYTARPVHGSPRQDEVIEFLAEFHSIPAADFAAHLYHKSQREVVEHLFHVASSLDSMVLGETQILGQVRDAYENAKQLSTAGPILNPLFQRAIAVGKQVMHETPLAEGRLSVASVAVDYAKGIFDHFHDKTVLCVGAGKMTQLVLKNFAALQPGRLMICNRNPEKAAALAARFGGEQVPFESLSEHLVAADIVLTSTGAAHPIITRQQFEGLRKRRRYRPIFLIDIAVPRDIEPTVGEIDGVYLYNLDDLQQVVSQTQAQRTDAIGSARAIVAKQIESFLSWHRQRELGPAIHRLYSRYHAIAQEELGRTLNKLPNVSEAEKAHLEDLARRIVNKLLHDPVQTLRNSDADHASAVPYLHALEKLFQLGDEKGNPEFDPSKTDSE
ncbi:MAG TPA: glutamyl-tRNA reductase [Tepidisphaeraceae bacterium]|nr:glutamyl-tRNA reductase [Tepidisphaeraceae bacterium]